MNEALQPSKKEPVKKLPGSFLIIFSACGRSKKMLRTLCSYLLILMA
jgi:hypothetical protein